MIDLTQVLDKLRHNYRDLEAEFGINQIYIFGSVARNTNKYSSDIDLLISFKKTPSIFFLESLMAYLRKILNAKIDIIVDNDELDENFRKRISKEMVKV